MKLGIQAKWSRSSFFIMNKITIPLAVVGLLAAGIFGAGALLNRTTHTEEAVKEIKTEVRRVEDKVIENDMIDVRQSVLIEGATATLERLNKRLDVELGE